MNALIETYQSVAGCYFAVGTGVTIWAGTNITGPVDSTSATIDTGITRARGDFAACSRESSGTRTATGGAVLNGRSSIDASDGVARTKLTRVAKVPVEAVAGELSVRNDRAITIWSTLIKQRSTDRRETGIADGMVTSDARVTRWAGTDEQGAVGVADTVVVARIPGTGSVFTGGAGVTIGTGTREGTVSW